MHMTLKGQNIIKGVKNDDIDSFKQLFDIHYAMLCGIANGYLNNKQSAEEIVNDVFCKIWENRKSLEIHTSVKAYLIRAVQNRCINYLGQKKFDRSLVSRISSEPSSEDFLCIDNNTPLSGIITVELENAINNAIESLPYECREIFRLSRFENLKYEEIAQQQKISVNTVKTQMKIALHKLRQVLSPYLA